MKKQSTLFRVGIFAIVFFILCVLPQRCHAAITNTTASATVTDSDSTVWANGTYVLTFVPSPNFPSIFPPTTTFTGSLDGSGSFSVSVPDNNSVASGSSYRIIVCSQTSAPCSVLAPTVITGSSQSLTTYIDASIVAPRFAANRYGAYGYSDVEVTPTPLAGYTYWNVTSTATRQWNGTAWVSAGGGGGVISFNSRTGAVTPQAADYSSFFLGLGGGTLTGPLTIQTPAGTEADVTFNPQGTNTASYTIRDTSSTDTPGWLTFVRNSNGRTDFAYGPIGGFTSQFTYSSGVVLGFAGNPDPRTGIVVGLSEGGSGTFDLGNGGYQDTSGTLNLGTINVNGGANTVYICSGGTFSGLLATSSAACTGGSGTATQVHIN